MASATRCESCGMPIPSGRYCEHCVDENGQLQPFEVRFKEMVGWMRRNDSRLNRAEAEQATKDYMRTMPAWRDHPALKE